MNHAVVSLVAGLWFGHQVQTVQERQSFIGRLSGYADQQHDDGRDNWLLLPGDGDDFWKVRTRGGVPWIWKLLGAQPIAQIRLDAKEFSQRDAERSSVIFPEAEIERGDCCHHP